MTRLGGKRALVTGGAAGIGRAIVEAFLDEGARVVATDIDADGLDALRGALDAGERLVTMPADVASAADWERAVALARERFGGLDILVNNAGIEMLGTVETLPEDAWDRVMAVNVKSMYLGARAALPLLRESRGAVVNMASINGRAGVAGSIAYVTSKHAIVGFTRGLALDCAKDGIRVNAVCPGPVDTPMVGRVVQLLGQGDAEAGYAILRSMTPLGRLIAPAEVAAVVVHLASDEASFTTGITYPIDGGYTAR